MVRDFLFNLQKNGDSYNMATGLCQGVNKIHKKMFDMSGGVEIVYTDIIRNFAGIAGIYVNDNGMETLGEKGAASIASTNPVRRTLCLKKRFTRFCIKFLRSGQKGLKSKCPSTLKERLNL